MPTPRSATKIAPALDYAAETARGTEPVRNGELNVQMQRRVQSIDRLLRLSELTLQLGISRSTVYRYVAAGRLPAPIQLSTRCIVWKASVIEAWIATLAAGDTQRS